MEEKELWMNKLKEKLADYSEPVPASGWEQLEKELMPPVEKKIYPYRKWMMAAAAVIILAVVSSVSLYFLGTPAADEIRHIQTPALASHMDDVIDGINSCAKRIAIYNPRPIGDSGKELSLLVQKEADYICKAMDELDTFRKNPATLREYCSKLHDIENQADDVYELFITKLFEEEKDCIEIIKIKEIMQILEKTTDSAEYVGKILRTLIVKYA